MLAINADLQREKQIDRACAAQAPDMLPKLPPSPKEMIAKKKAMEASINARFPKRK